MSDNNNGGGSRSFFHMAFSGRLGRDPEMRYTPQGKAVCNMSVACNINQYINGSFSTVTAWLRVTVWGAAAEACNTYLRKGSEVIVEADSLKVDPDSGGPVTFARRDGTVGSSFEIPSARVTFVGGKRDGETYAADEPEEEVIPF